MKKKYFNGQLKLKLTIESIASILNYYTSCTLFVDVFVSCKYRVICRWKKTSRSGGNGLIRSSAVRIPGPLLPACRLLIPAAAGPFRLFRLLFPSEVSGRYGNDESPARETRSRKGPNRTVSRTWATSLEWWHRYPSRILQELAITRLWVLSSLTRRRFTCHSRDSPSTTAARSRKVKGKNGPRKWEW